MLLYKLIIYMLYLNLKEISNFQIKPVHISLEKELLLNRNFISISHKQDSITHYVQSLMYRATSA